jgi:hypothetical protein
MDRKDFQHIEMLTRVVEFGTAHVGEFPKNTVAGQSFAALGSALSKLSEDATLHVSSKNAVRSSRKAREAARDNLWQQLQHISNTALAISIDEPHVDLQFQMPKRGRDQQLIHTAKAFAEWAEQLKKAFVQHRLPDEFIENLQNAIADLERAIEQQVSSKTSQTSATTALEEDFAKCQALLKRVDAVVENTLGNDAAVMAEWRSRRRIPRRSSQPAAETQPSEPPASAPATPVA